MVIFNCNNYAANNRFEVGELNQEQQSLIDTFYSTEPVPMLKHPFYIETLFVPCLGSARYALEVIRAREQVANKQVTSHRPNRAMLLISLANAR